MLVREQDQIRSVFHAAWSHKRGELEIARSKANQNAVAKTLAMPAWQELDATLNRHGFAPGMVTRLAEAAGAGGATIGISNPKMIGTRPIDADLRANGFQFEKVPPSTTVDQLSIATITCGKKWKDIAYDFIVFSSELGAATTIEGMDRAARRFMDALAK